MNHTAACLISSVDQVYYINNYFPTLTAYLRNVVSKSKDTINNHFLILFKILTLLLRHITGQREHPNVQQQHKHPQNNHFTLTGKVFFKIPLILITVSLNSSGATRDTNPLGNSVLNLLLKPNLQQ